MSIYGLPGSCMYWNSTTRVDCVADTMTMHRWEAIKHNIHFADNTQLIPRGQPGHDQLHKVRPLLTSLLESFQAIPMDEGLCVDEQIVPFKGRSGLKQYNPKKTKHWGYKIYVLSDSNGIAYNFQVHTGPMSPMDGMPDIGASGNIVLRLASIIPGNQSHKLFFDNWFTSVDLQTILQKRKIHCVGTVRQNRLAGGSFSDDKVMKKKGRGTF
ncbi:PiggyBac transposable element-derived protein 2 [Dissostichus eleginoides]|uniref:PiggyBac transposable element-derived protein 2 n=1 Tax=Dissostichus eleginoides TaxID=100907 RepID=A0AAD9EZP7_DISEL|nr:PiggyBac transposable element-derived protein 2 [Dissostichus eleginoides]